MQKEQWINEVLESTQGMQKAEPGPFLFEKVTARIEKSKLVPIENENTSYFKWRFLIAACIIIVVNVFAIRSYLNNGTSPTASEIQNTGSSAENNYNYSTIYSY